ncbi:hypothetical protein, partial [Legionella pneumophila]
MNRRLVREGLTGELFNTQEDYNNWKSNLVSARNQQTQALKQEPVLSETQAPRQETPVPAQEKPKG